MRASTFSHAASDGKALFVHQFLPDEAPRAVLHISHGMAEHAARYGRVAQALTAAGFAVYANDHRGHGKTAASEAELGVFQGGIKRVVQDLEELITFERSQHPGLPVVLFGHSMGSYFAQELLITHGDWFVAAVLSGSSGKPTFIASLGRYVARLERLRLGPAGHSGLLGSLSFGAFNKQFAPNRTEFDWLSRDQAEVDAYIADPLCGFEVGTSTWVDLLDLLGELAKPERQARIPKALPVYIFAGSDDPVSEKTSGLEQLRGAYAAAGLKDVTHKYYPGARHEVLNETVREEVTRDLVAWLEKKVQR